MLVREERTNRCPGDLLMAALVIAMLIFTLLFFIVTVIISAGR